MENEKELIAPLVITRSLVAFPSNPTTIEVVRESSLASIEASKDFDNCVLLVSQKNPDIENPTDEDIYYIGTFCCVISVTKLKEYTRVRLDPRYRIRITSMTTKPDGLSRIATYERVEDVIGDRVEEEALVKAIIHELEQMPELISVLPKALINQLSKGVSSNQLSNLLSNNLPIDPAQKQSLLETTDVNKRLTVLLQVLNQQKVISDVEKKISADVRESTDKSQREYILREKLKAIRKELGEDEDASDSESKILERLDNNPYPENIKAKVKSELKRYQMRLLLG